MALTYTDNTAVFAEGEAICDTSGTWSSLGTGAGTGLCCDVTRVGCQSISKRLSNARGGFQFARTCAIDMCTACSPQGMVTFWTQLNGIPSCTACTGGLTVRVGSAACAYREWQVVTGANYPGGWQKFTVYVCAPGGSDTGTPAWCAVDYFAMQWDSTTAYMGNVKAVWTDEVRYLTAAQVAGGCAAATVTGTVTTEGALFEETFTAAGNCTARGLSQLGGAFNLSASIEFGGAATCQTFTSQNELVTVGPLTLASNGVQFIRFLGNATGTHIHDWGAVCGTTGTCGTTVVNASISCAEFNVLASCASIDTFTIFGSTFQGLNEVEFGNACTALGTACATINFANNTFATINGQVKTNYGNFATETTNKIVDAQNVACNDGVNALNRLCGSAVDGTDWQIVQSPGFEDSNDTTGTITLTCHTVPNIAAAKPYVTVNGNACNGQTFNIDNYDNGCGGRVTIASQTELSFVDNTNGTVNERFCVNWNVTEPAGCAVSGAKVVITEATVPIPNRCNTNACGTDNALNLHGFRTRLNGLFIYCATGNGVEIHCCEACIIKDTKILRSKGYGFKSHNATDWIVQDSYIIGGCTDGIIMIACSVPVADNNSLRGTVIHNNAGYQINIGTCVSEFYIDPTSHVGTGGSGRLLDNGISTMDEDVANRTDTIRKIHTNRQVITGNQLIIYDDDDVTALFTFDLKDASDVATEDNPKKKVPV